MMEQIKEIVFGKAWPLVCATAMDTRLLVQSPRTFLHQMKDRSQLCPNAWFFGSIAAMGLGVLGLPALRLAGVTPSLELGGMMTLINWLLIALYGICFGFAAQMLGTRRSMLVTVNTFFYLSALLVVLKLFESPALGARFAAMLQTCSSLDFSDAVTAAIGKSKTMIASNNNVFVGYALFSALMIWTLRVLHDFSWKKATFAMIIGMVLLSVVVSNVQGPMIAQLVCAYSGP
ncbi:hypothetical protein ACW9I8_01375 [Pseudomonas reactans]